MESDGESILPTWFRIEYMQMPEPPVNLAKIYTDEQNSDSELYNGLGQKKLTPRGSESNRSVDSVFVTCISEDTERGEIEGLKSLTDSQVMEWNKLNLEEEEEKLALRNMSFKVLSDEYIKLTLECERLENIYEELQMARK